MMTYLLIAIGSAVGGVARYSTSLFVATKTQSVLPVGTIFVNVMGSFLIGAIAGAIDTDSRLAVSPATRDAINHFWMIGVLGGYTTFSSFSLQTLVLIRDQQWIAAGLNVAVSVVACLTAVAVGFWIANLLTR